jgi:hypothetical protein
MPEAVMDYPKRQELYRQIEQDRETKVLSFITSDRMGMETVIAQDCIDPFVDLLEKIGPTERISLLLHTNGGQTLAAWRLVNLIRIFCDELEVLIPLKALSAGTLISIGADRVVMTKQAALGPIDPSVNNPLNPQASIGGQLKQVPVSVESVRGYLDAAREELKIEGEHSLTSVLLNLTTHIHPLVLGEIFRTQAQIRFLAEKLLPRQVEDKEKIKSIIDFLCADSGSHDYTIDRREAADLGLNIEKPSDEFYKLLRKIHLSYAQELKLLEPYTPQAYLAGAQMNIPTPFTITRGLAEGTAGGCYGFVSEGTLMRVQVQTNNGPQEGVKDERTFEGWRKLL